MSDNLKSQEKRFIRSPEADHTLAGDRAVIYHKKSSSAITLNEAGTVLWLMLEGGRTRGELEAGLREKWPQLSAEVAARDAEAFLGELLRHDFCLVVD